ncbi:MAG TPA: RNase adapter RapZ [Mycobacteriales bacterium]|nr:RNase adapter RapZ [Mycobacteriales bacterium]
MSAERTSVGAASPVELTIVTGLSGAGRSTAAKCLEDLGWFVVDNLPPRLLAAMAELAGRSDGSVQRVAVVVDVRGRGFFADLRASLDQLDRRLVSPRVLFLEAADDVLVRRFESVRRPHPLQEGARLVDEIALERNLLRDLRGEADLIVDTTTLNVHELRATIEQAFGAADRAALTATVVSFGFKYGLPVDADLVADVRFLPNPHWVEELRARTGREEPVRTFVLAQDGATEFLDRYTEVLHTVRRGYLREGKHFVTLAVGCTGGKHRSVVMAEQLAARLEAAGVPSRTVHRDLGRE